MVSITPEQVRRKGENGEDIVLLDVRTHSEFEHSRLEGATHIPIGALRGRLGELPRDKEIITFSHVSLSAYEAAIILKANGFPNVEVMDGGVVMWPTAKSAD
jgi:rhodanese-related sulfurtransferase